MRPRDVIVAGLRRVIRYHVAASTALYLLGVLAAALYPALARRTFIDENAFLVAQTTVGFDRRDARDALEHYRAAIDAARTSPGDVHRSDALRGWLEDELDALGMERYRQAFALDRHSWTRGDDDWGRRSDASIDNATHGVNVHAVARAARGNGREGIVLATPIGAPGATLEADAAALALGLVVMRTIAAAPWLAKDVAWLVADARWGPGDHGIAATDAWLREYHAPGLSAHGAGHRARRSGGGARPSPSSFKPFGRVGALQQAYVVELPEGAVADVASINVVGFNGALPNQDLVNVPVQLAKLAGFPRAGIFADSSTAGTGDGGRGRVGGGDVFDALGAVVGGAPFAADLRRVAGFALALARGTPAGSHASFKSYAVDAVTVRMSGERVPTGVPTGGAHRRGDPGRGVSGEDAFLRLGTFAESAVRCSNNLLETLHHSMFYYLMVDDDRFLSIAEYVAPQGLMLASSLVTAIALAVIGTSTAREETSTSTGGYAPVSLAEKRRGKEERGKAATAPTQDWSSALALALLAHVAGWCALLVASTWPASTAAQLAAAYAGALATAAAALATWSKSAGDGDEGDGDEGDGDEGDDGDTVDGRVGRARREPPWATLKVVALSVQVASLGALTFFNFALAVAVAAPLAPLQLAAHGGVGGAIPPWARAALTLVAAPVLLVTMSCAALGTEASTALGDAAAAHVAWGRRVHVLPLAWCVAWPGLVLAACVHLGGVHLGGVRGRGGASTREEAPGGPEGKKRR